MQKRVRFRKRALVIVAGVSAAFWILSGSGSSLRVLRIQGALADTPSSAWTCVVAQPALVGHWEIQVDGDFSEFVFNKSLYPGNPSTRVALSHVEITKDEGRILLTSDQIELKIHPDKPATGICPVYGETCYSAKVLKVDISDVGAAASSRLMRSPWSCSPLKRAE